MFVVVCVLPMTCLATPRHPTLARPRRLPRRPPDRFGVIIQVPLSLLSVSRLVPLLLFLDDSSTGSYQIHFTAPLFPTAACLRLHPQPP